jgi:hypothetical protein
MKLYVIEEKDPIIGVLHELIATRARLENKSFNAILYALDKESKREIRYGTLNQWFWGTTKCPLYASVARVYLAMRAYSRKPLQIGDKTVEPVNLLDTSRRKVA